MPSANNHSVAKESIEQRLLGFARFLRNHEFHINLADIRDAVNSCQQLHAPNQGISRQVLKSLCTQNRDQWQSFDALFEQYWFQTEFTAARKVASMPKSGSGQENNASVVGLSGTSETHLADNDFQTMGTGAGKQTTLSKANFRFITDRQAMRKVEHLAERLSRLASQRLARQYDCRPSGQQLNFRKTIRANLQNGMSLKQLQFKQRRKQAPQLILLHDISHSMSWNNPLLFRFSRGLIRHVKDSLAYVFHTELYPVTRLYRLDSLQQIRQQLESNNHLWLGGTSIASSIECYLNDYGHLQKKHSTVVIMSDGFDTDSTDQLMQSLQQLQQCSERLIWLSPMLDNPDYEPSPAFQQAIDQYLDAFLPCSSLASLETAIQHILRIHH